MNFAALKTELAARGFNHLSDAQLGTDINRARRYLDHLFLWPYREASATGVAPLEVQDLVTVEAVVSETRNRPLSPGDFRSLLADYGDLSESGPAEFFYVAAPANGVPVVATFPTNADTIGVQYYRTTPDLEEDGDEPLAPARFHGLIVEIAAQHAYRRTDNPQAAQALQPGIDVELASMIDQLLGGQQIAGPQGHMSVYEACDA